MSSNFYPNVHNITPVATTIEKVNVWLLFSCCKCNQEVTLIIEGQIALLFNIVHLDSMNGIALFAALLLFEKLKLCNKHQSFFAKHFSFMINQIPKENLASQLDKMCIKLCTSLHLTFYCPHVNMDGITYN